MSTHMSPSEAGIVAECLMFEKDKLAFGGTKNLDPRERSALAQVVWRRLQKGERQEDVANDLGISQPTISRLKYEAVNAFALPSIEQGRKDYLQTCEDQVAYYIKMRDGEPENEKWHGYLYKWEQELAKVTGAYAPLQVEATVTEVSAEERELQEMLAQVQRDEAVREAALKSEV